MRFVFPHSHAFRGGRVELDDDGRPGPQCLVEFGDNVTVIAEWQPDGEAIHLAIPQYHTARGRAVLARTWQLTRDVKGHWRSQRHEGSQIQ